MGEASPALFNIFGLNVTAEVTTQWGIIVLVALLSLLVTHNLKEKPGKLQNAGEYLIDYLLGFLGDILGEVKARKYFSFLATLFIFIITCNYSGLLPGSGTITGFKAPTSSLSVTLGFGVCSFVAIQYYGIKQHRGKYALRFFKPVAIVFPLMILDEFIKPASLALRLYGNIFGEESVTEQLYNIAPVGPPILMMALSCLFCAIQAIVFTMLTAIYLDESTEEIE